MSAPRRPRRAGTLALGALAGALGGCAMSPSGLAGPSAPAAQGYPSSQQQMGAPSPAAPPAAAAAPPPPPPAGAPPGGRFAQPPGDPAPPSGGAADEAVSLATALFRFEASARQLELSLSSCEVACRALGSMERAAQRVCELARASDEGPRCDDARSRLRSARARVRAACGGCPDGPTTEPQAP